MRCCRGGIWTFVVCRRQDGGEAVLDASEFFVIGFEEGMAGVLVANKWIEKVLEVTRIGLHNKMIKALYNMTKVSDNRYIYSKFLYIRPRTA